MQGGWVEGHGPECRMISFEVMAGTKKVLALPALSKCPSPWSSLPLHRPLVGTMVPFIACASIMQLYPTFLTPRFHERDEFG